MSKNDLVNRTRKLWSVGNEKIEVVKELKKKTGIAESRLIDEAIDLLEEHHNNKPLSLIDLIEYVMDKTGKTKKELFSEIMRDLEQKYPEEVQQWKDSNLYF
ncbi:ribbon-helix-helix domain-containing protein [Bacillus cereus]|uniref:ribbon-helix-helix domain-containing protein n=1 Tax=Bacillus cereus TaxID=1396 RepID=UPI001879B9D6|nr:ribbon-helix-helix domain-containing protein [Bacillus cereus]MBE7123458.1 ribbon-helix-helix domain-containing protein [Bacillus cereus]